MTDGGPWTGLLARTDRAERENVLEGLITGRFREALLIAAGDPVPLDENYFALGLTSLSAVEIEQDLRTALGRPISTTDILNNPTIGHLIAYLRADVLADLFAGGRGAPRAEAAGLEQAGREAVPAGRRAILDGLLRDLYKS